MNDKTISRVMAEMVRRRWAKTTKAERSEYARRIATAQSAAMTPEQRSERARKAGQARARKAGQKLRDA